MSGKEAEFRQRLAAALSGPPYCHKVYLHGQFSVHGAKEHIDLYVEASPAWLHRSEFPILGVEVATAASMEWLIDAIDRADKYRDELAKASYFVEGKKASPPALFLVVTPESWETGLLSGELPAELRGIGTEQEEAARRGCWFGLTALYEELLMNRGAALVRRGTFLARPKGGGPAIRYHLAATAL